MSKAELKPCPFCGCENVIAEISNITNDFRIYCENCPVEMRLSYTDAKLGDGSFISFYELRKVMDDMTEHWNEREYNEQREAD